MIVLESMSGKNFTILYKKCFEILKFKGFEVIQIKAFTCRI